MLLEPPSPELQIVIRDEVNEDLDTRDNYLQAIKFWLFHQPHLPDTWDEIQLLNFLRGCNYSIEKCKKKLETYFTMRAAAPELCCNRNFKNLELLNISKIVTFPPLPHLTNEGRRVTVLRINDRNATGPIEEVIKLILMLLDLRLLLEEFGVTGEVYIMDAETVSQNHIALLTPDLLKKLLIIIYEIYPMELKEIHIINVQPIVNTIFSWLKPVLKKRIKDSIHIHTDGMESLYEFVPKEILPEEYGGTAGKLQHLHDLWMRELENHEPWFTEQEDVKCDESVRL